LHLMLYTQAVSKRDESNGNDRYGVLLSTCSCRLLWSGDYKFRCRFLVFHRGGDDGLERDLQTDLVDLRGAGMVW